MKETDEPAATETVEVLAPLSPPTLHLRSSDVRSRGVSEEQQLDDEIHTSDRRVVVGVHSNILIGCVRLTVGGERLEDV